MAKGYCFKCKGKQELLQGKLIYYKNGVPAEKGTCAGCGAKMLRIMTKEERGEIKRQARISLGDKDGQS